MMNMKLLEVVTPLSIYQYWTISGIIPHGTDYDADIDLSPRGYFGWYCDLELQFYLEWTNEIFPFANLYINNNHYGKLIFINLLYYSTITVKYDESIVSYNSSYININPYLFPFTALLN